ncbi:iron-containing redox enzyme family protein [soil metagenome]
MSVSSSLPAARGPISEQLLAALARAPHALTLPTSTIGDPLTDDDVQLTLYLCYELHYRGLSGVDDRWEWEPSMLAGRRTLEDSFEAALRAECEPTPGPVVIGRDLPATIAAATGPSLSTYVLERGTLDQVREFAMHRSAYQLKEADPHSWAIPRLEGRAKAALVRIQADEYGDGNEPEMHAVLFAHTMAALSLDPTYGAYVDLLPGVTLATVNAISLFGLHRRLRGALVGHLATFEMTSVAPMERYARAMRRLGLGTAGARFYDVHVEADAVHEVIALQELAGGMAAAEPALGSEILFGARVAMTTEGRFASHLLACWEQGDSSLRRAPLLACDPAA